MTIKPFVRRALAASLLFVISVAGTVQARPMREFQDEKGQVRKLPPVHYVRSRNYDMRHVALNLRFDWDKESAFGTAALTLAPLAPSLKTVDLDAGGMTVNSVKLSGKELKFSYSEAETRLSVDLDRPYKFGEELTLVVDYRTNGAVVTNTLGFGAGGGLKFTKPSADAPNVRRQVWSQGESDYNRYWFPSYDSPNDFRTSELTATVEKPLFVVGNGRLAERRDNKDGTESFHWKMDTPYANYLTSIVVGEYAELKGEYAGIPVVSYVYPNEVRQGTITTKNLPAMVRFFSEKTGVKYPYVKYAQTMAESFNGGMENITATTMTPDMIHDERELLDGDSEGLQSHELAHQWFGDYVTTREWSDIWLNESFATYFQALWDEHSKGHDYFLFNDVRSNQQAYLGAWNQGQRRPIVTKYYTNADALFDTYAYPRGGAVLHMLRKHLGDELFFKGLNHYLTTNANRPVQTEQLRIAIEEATGQSMDWFFDQWLYRMGHPVFEVTQSYDEATKKLTLNVKQTQKVDPLNEYPQVTFFQTNVDIAIDGNVQRVWIKPQAENVFTFDVSAKPKIVSFDHEGTLIKELKFEKSTDDLLYQLANDKDLLGRDWALNRLGERLKAKETSEADRVKITAAINRMITAESFWGLRREALETVAAMPPGGMNAPPPVYDAGTVAALKAAAGDPVSNVRAAALNRLSFLRDAQYADLLLKGLGDQSYSVTEASAVGLARLKDPKHYDVLATLAGTDSWKNRIRVAGLQSLALLGDKRALDLGFKYAGKDYQPMVRTAALAVLGGVGKGDPRVFPMLFDNFKKALTDNSFQGVFSGLQSFARLGDPRAQEAFDMAREKYKDNQQLMNFLNQIETQFKRSLTQQ